MLYKMVSILLLFLLFLPLGGLTADHFPTSHPIPTILFLHPQTFTVFFLFSSYHTAESSTGCKNKTKNKPQGRGSCLLTQRNWKSRLYTLSLSHLSGAASSLMTRTTVAESKWGGAKIMGQCKCNAYSLLFRHLYFPCLNLLS